MPQQSRPFGSVDIPALPAKPRSTAVTSVLDKGAGPAAVDDLIAVAGEYVDVVKLGWATARLTGAAALEQKVAKYAAAGIAVCSGGTFFEIAVAQGKVDEFLADAKSLGLSMVEVSNGVHPMSPDEKLALIEKAKAAGFVVWSEVGRKDPLEDARITITERTAAVARELDAGADKVVLEARESGTVGIYDASGQPAAELLDRLVDRCGSERLVFEAPQKSQQLWMIRRFGSEVNLANVALSDALSVATLRTGLRADTFADMHLPGVDVYVELGVSGAIEARDRGGVVVMIDALRASATIITAIATGMRAVKVVPTVEQCVGEVTAGERGGKKLPGVDHGNSPSELAARDYAGKELVLTSTNGAEVLVTAAAGDTTVLVGSTINAAAVAARALAIARDRGVPITLLKAGRNTLDAVEDGLAAGEILRGMQGVHLRGAAPPQASALEAAFVNGDSGQNLIALGYAEDVKFCAQRDIFETVPVWKDGRVVDIAGDPA